MKKIRFRLMIGLMITLLLCGCGKKITDPLGPDTGSANLSIVLNAVGSLSKVNTINLDRLCIEMASGEEIVRDTIAVSGSAQNTVSKNYTDLDVGDWTLTAKTIDDDDIIIHQGDTSFTITAFTTTDVSLDLTSIYSMLTANFICIDDSVSRLELLVDAAKVADTIFVQGSESGNTISLDYDYLETGQSHTIKLDAYGSMQGTESLLFTGDTTITVVAGVDTTLEISLDYVGPELPEFGGARLVIVIGKSGLSTVNGEFEWLFRYDMMTDIDGNTYKTIKIGDQWWMTENLKVTHYRNGDPIPNVTDATTWEDLTTGAYCNYDNDDSNADTYGSLYNWYAVEDSLGLAPEGWHVPTDEEWKQLEMFLGMSQSEADNEEQRGMDEGNKLKSTSEWYNDGNGTDEYRFTALPGGFRTSDGTYYYQGKYAYFWSETEYNTNYAWPRLLAYLNSGISRPYIINKECGFSVRCVKD